MESEVFHTLPSATCEDTLAITCCGHDWIHISILGLARTHRTKVCAALRAHCALLSSYGTWKIWSVSWRGQDRGTEHLRSDLPFLYNARRRNLAGAQIAKTMCYNFESADPCATLPCRASVTAKVREKQDLAPVRALPLHRSLPNAIVGIKWLLLLRCHCTTCHLSILCSSARTVRAAPRPCALLHSYVSYMPTENACFLLGIF